MASMTGWRVIANVMLPIPVLLTVLLVAPFPRNIRKGILVFTNSVLSFPVLGGMKLVHFALIMAGIPFIDSGMRTYASTQAVHEELRPDMKMQVLAKKWRDERNFWIAAMAFTMWGLLTAMYAIVNTLIRLEDENERLQDELNDAKGIPRATKNTNRMRVAGAVAHAVQGLGMRVPPSIRAAADGANGSAAAAPAAEGEASDSLLDSADASGTPARNLRSRARQA